MSDEEPVRIVVSDPSQEAQQGVGSADGIFIDDVIPRTADAPQKVPFKDRSSQKGRGAKKGAGRRGANQRGMGAGAGSGYDYFQDMYGGMPPGHFGGDSQGAMAMPPPGAFGMMASGGTTMYQPWGMMPSPFMAGPMPGWGMPFQPPSFPMSGMPSMPPGMMQEGGKGSIGHARTTVMLRNLPPEYTRDMVIRLLNTEGFERLYDFVYMPMNLRTMASFGYVFVNLVSPVVADQCRSVFQGLSCWEIESDKVCDVLWSTEQQGLSANIERYRNSPVMHEVVPEECKPVVLANGVQVPFLAPTKRLREPRIRRPQAAATTSTDAAEAAEPAVLND